MSGEKYDTFETSILVLIGVRVYVTLLCTTIGLVVFVGVNKVSEIIGPTLAPESQIWLAMLLAGLVGLSWASIQFVQMQRQFVGAKPPAWEDVRASRSLVSHAGFIDTQEAEQWATSTPSAVGVKILVGLGFGLPAVAFARVLILGGVLPAILITLLAVAVLLAFVRSDIDVVRPLSWHIGIVTSPLLILPLAVFIAATPFVYEIVSPDISTRFIENTASSPLHLVLSFVALVAVTIVSTHCLLIAYDAIRQGRGDGSTTVAAQPERMADRSPDEILVVRAMVSMAVGLTPPTLALVILDTFGLTAFTATAVIVSSAFVFGLVVAISPDAVPVSYTDFTAVVIGLAGASILGTGVVTALLTSSIGWAKFVLLVPVAVVVGFTSAIPLRAVPLVTGEYSTGQ